MKGHKKRLVVLTGAGMSAESGLKTFRDAGGLWEEIIFTSGSTGMPKGVEITDGNLNRFTQ